jgi:probable phosphomutase (TIGR03848 family)
MGESGGDAQPRREEVGPYAGAVALAILVRHGRTAANTDGVLAGRTPGIHLDETGQKQAAELGRRLAGLPLSRIVSSPLERTLETAREIAHAHTPRPRVHRDKGLIECGYGDWTGRRLKDLAKQKLWSTVQNHPSAVMFPGGESMVQMQTRALSAVRRWDAEVQAEAGSGGIWVAVSHGDVIKAVVADALGLHLDQFQRIVIGPAAVCVVEYTAHRPFVLHVNDTGSDLSALRDGTRPAKGRRRRGSSDAPVGGGS